MELVAAEGQHVNVLLFYVDRHIADSLYGVGMEPNAMLFADFTNLRDGLDGADLVIGIHDGDKAGLIGDGGLELFRDDDAVFMDVEVRDLKALFFERCAGVQHRVVLKLACDDVVLALFQHLVRCALNGPVVAFAAAACEVDLIRLCTETFCYFCTCFLKRLFCSRAERIQA